MVCQPATAIILGVVSLVMLLVFAFLWSLELIIAVEEAGVRIIYRPLFVNHLIEWNKITSVQTTTYRAFYSPTLSAITCRRSKYKTVERSDRRETNFKK